MLHGFIWVVLVVVRDWSSCSCFFMSFPWQRKCFMGSLLYSFIIVLFWPVKLWGSFHQHDYSVGGDAFIIHARSVGGVAGHFWSGSFSGVICRAATWASAHIVIKYYNIGFLSPVEAAFRQRVLQTELGVHMLGATLPWALERNWVLKSLE